MSNIISRYKAILPVSLFALSAQGVMAQDATEAQKVYTILYYRARQTKMNIG